MSRKKLEGSDTIQITVKAIGKLGGFAGAFVLAWELTGKEK